MVVSLLELSVSSSGAVFPTCTKVKLDCHIHVCSSVCMSHTLVL